MVDPGGGGNRRAPPLNFDRLWFFLIQFCIRMLQNEAQIAWECITTLQLSHSWCAMRAHNLLRPHYWEILGPPLFQVGFPFLSKKIIYALTCLLEFDDKLLFFSLSRSGVLCNAPRHGLPGIRGQNRIKRCLPQLDPKWLELAPPRRGPGRYGGGWARGP